MDKLVIFLLIIFLVFWGAILFQTPEFLEIARASIPLALFIWIGGSAVNVAGIMFAAIVGLGLGPRDDEPVSGAVKVVGLDTKPQKEYHEKTGKNLVDCPSQTDYEIDTQIRPLFGVRIEDLPRRDGG